MSELRSAIESLRTETLPELPDARIEDDFAELQRAIEQLEVERLRRLAEIDRRRLFERDGHLSAASWLATIFRVAWGGARDQVRTARALQEMPPRPGSRWKPGTYRRRRFECSSRREKRNRRRSKLLRRI